MEGCGSMPPTAGTPCPTAVRSGYLVSIPDAVGPVAEADLLATRTAGEALHLLGAFLHRAQGLGARRLHWCSCS